MMLVETVEHTLSFVVRADDHFTGKPVPEPVTVVVEPREHGVRTLSGGFRHDDGTYRYAHLAPGLRRIKVTSPTGRWRTWQPDPIVVVPLAEPRDVVVVEMWPTPLAPAIPGVTTIRGKVVGLGFDQRVEIEPSVVPARGRHTRTDHHGDFLFPLPGWLELDADGLVEITVAVPGHTVSDVEIVTGSSVQIAGATFSVPPGRETRVRINV